MCVDGSWLRISLRLIPFPPKTTQPLSPSTLVPPPTFKSSAFWSNPYCLLSLCAARCSLLWRRLTADLKAPHSALYIVPVTPQYTLSKEGLATELYASITNLQRPSCEVAAVLNFKFPSLKKRKKKKIIFQVLLKSLPLPKNFCQGARLDK